MDNIELFELTVYISSFLLKSSFFILIACDLCIIAYCFVNECERPNNYIDDLMLFDDENYNFDNYAVRWYYMIKFCLQLPAIPFVLAIIYKIWIIALIVFFIFLGLYSARYVVRLNKKINKASK